MPWPLEPEGVLEFAEGLDEILVVEEKRDLLEAQLKSHLYDAGEHDSPRILGKRDEQRPPAARATAARSHPATSRAPW